MAMRIRVKNRATADKIWRALWEKLRLSRFEVSELSVLAITARSGDRFDVVIGSSDYSYGSGIRLKTAKHYCGNHPGPCPIRPGGPRPHRTTRFLEGLDWVAFNDMVNDVLDRLHVDVIKAGTSLVSIRRGRCRRINYDSDWVGPDLNFQEWQRTGNEVHDYQDYCGRKAPRSGCPGGTPGNRGWKAAVPA